MSVFSSCNINIKNYGIISTPRESKKNLESPGKVIKLAIDVSHNVLYTTLIVFTRNQINLNRTATMIHDFLIYYGLKALFYYLINILHVNSLSLQPHFLSLISLLLLLLLSCQVYVLVMSTNIVIFEYIYNVTA